MELLHPFFLFFGQSLGNIDGYVDEHVALPYLASVLVNLREALAAQSQRLPALRAGVDSDFDFTVERRYLQLRAESGRRNVDEEVVDEVVAVAQE